MGRATPPPPVDTGPQRRLQYQPALDGLRAVALLGVVAYHAGIDDLHGGFLGVSTFFTLSGFLITSLLIREQVASGRIALGGFWTRRLRRLMPAALVTIAATTVFAAAIGDDSQIARLRADGLASLFHFSNWRFIAEGDSYGALFQSPSFFRHFWSLAVEEQYYLAVPPLIAAALAVAGRRTARTGGSVAGSRGLAAFLVVFAGAGLAWPAILQGAGAGTDRLYFGTDTRLGELAVGALLALWFVRRDQQLATGPRGVAVATLLTVPAVVGTAVLWHTAHPGDAFLYRGGLALHALLTVPIIVAAVAPGGPVRALLSFEPLRRLGVISYGAYLTHWPILLWLQQDTDLGPYERFAVGTALTVVVSIALHRTVEQPFRAGARAGRVRPWVAVPASLTVALLVVGVTTWRQPAAPPIDFAAAQDALDELDAPEPPGADEPGPSTDEPGTGDPAPLRLAAFGDSTALMTGLGILQWAEDHPDEVEVVRGNAKLGCGLLSGGTRMVEGREVDVPDDCDGWLDDWLAELGGGRVDVAVVQLGAWEVTDHRLAGRDDFLSIDDPTHRARQRAALDETILALRDHADVVALLAHPDVGDGRLATVPAGTTYPEYDPQRAQAWRDLVYEAADGPDAVDADRTVVVDLASWIAARPDDLRLRPDGVHFSQETGAEVADWLVPEIRRAVDTALATADGPVDPAGPVEPPEPEPEPLRVLLAGDSLMVDSEGAITAALETSERPIVVRFEGQPARPRTEAQTEDWRSRVEAFGPDLVIEYMGYWESAAGGFEDPPYGTEGFADGYRIRTLDPWFDHLASIGSDEIVLAAAPVDNPEVTRVIADVVAILEEDVRDRPGVWFVPTASALAPDGFTAALPDPRTGVLERIRRVDGLHLCPDGAERVTDLVLDVLGREYGLSFDDTWRDGDWRVSLPIDLAAECPPIR